ncbi:MAG TPA: transposase [Xanthobacteraceae bacterium]|nr:transposase [Xanthobacteraceae bacterium]
MSRLDIVDTGRRRRWSAEAKLRIVEESLSAPRRVSATARRHGISNQLLFSWRKAYRAGRLGGPAGFVPAMVVGDSSTIVGAASGGRIEIVSANGRRVIVNCDVEVEALLRIMRGLETLP